MRHRKLGRQLSRTSSHRRAVLRNLAASLFLTEQGRITTTEAKAKEVRPFVEKIITLGKRGSIHARRRAIALLGSKEAVSKLFDEIAGRYANRNGGYTRLIRLAQGRRGDNAPRMILELVTEEAPAASATAVAEKPAETAETTEAAEETPAAESADSDEDTEADEPESGTGESPEKT